MTKWKKLLLVLFVLNWLVIWGNSALPARSSHTLSDWMIYGFETAFQPSSSDAAASAPASSAEASSVPASSAETSSAPASSAETSSQATSSTPGIAIGHISKDAKQTLINSDWTSTLRTVFRKIAHVSEFLTFGLLAMLVLAGGDIRRWKLPAIIGFGVALIDETIQIFVGRTGTVRDIWIDLGGLAAGILLAAGLTALYRRRRNRA